MKKTIKPKGFTLIEILIVITLIGVLAALVAGALGAFGGAKARDAVRISDLNQVATMVGSLQNRFHVPPLSGKGRKYPNDCKTEGGNLEKCFQVLKMVPDGELYELLSDPKQGATIGSNEFQYYYIASTDGFKVCAHMEDQGAFENMNANNTGVITSSVEAGENTSHMHCVVHGRNIEEKPVNPITVTEPT